MCILKQICAYLCLYISISTYVTIYTYIDTYREIQIKQACPLNFLSYNLEGQIKKKKIHFSCQHLFFLYFVLQNDSLLQIVESYCLKYNNSIFETKYDEEQTVLILETVYKSPSAKIKIPGSLASAPEILNQEVYHKVHDSTALIPC